MHRAWVGGLFCPTLLSCPAGSEAANSSLERDLVLESSFRSDFKGFYARRHFIQSDDPENSWSGVWTLHSKAHIAAADSGGSISEEPAERGF